MPRSALRAAAAVVLVGFAPPLLAQLPRPPSIQSISVPASARAAAATVDAFHAALRRGDTAGAAAFLADDALIYEQGGAERSKAEYSAAHLAADAAFSRAVASVLTRRSAGEAGGMAWVASEGRSRGTFRDRAVDRVTVETMVLRQVGGAWRIVHIHWSSATQGR